MMTAPRHPPVNLQEPIQKTVGRRVPPTATAGLQRTINEVFASQGHQLWPRGVYRFATHEEANEWKMKMIRPRTAS